MGRTIYRSGVLRPVVFLLAFSICRLMIFAIRIANAKDAEPLGSAFAIPVQLPSTGDDTKHNQHNYKRDEKDVIRDNDTFSFHKTREQTETTDYSNHQVDFLEWSKSVMGIETILEIQAFDYYDYTRELASKNFLNDWDNDDDISFLSEDEVNSPLLSVRGLAASRDISVGEVVIEIPFLSLLSIPTTIDRDPVLSELMGPSARDKHGWAISSAGSSAQFMEDPEIVSLHELALLAVALLYHKSLGNGSPLEKYVEVLQATPLDSMPFLWARDKMQQSPLILHEAIRSVAMGLRRDIRDMYKSIVSVLLKDHPEIFTEEMLSFSEFEWAFAIVNSRHWQLQIDDLAPEHVNNPHRQVRSHAFIEDQVPPAEMPTDAWVLENEENDVDDTLDDVPADLEENEHHASQPFKAAMTKHSFVAPVADLLNFGPPCTRGHYNAETKTFQIISTCPFRKGQEVTFWYSDKCDYVMIGMYGFTHPVSMIFAKWRCKWSRCRLTSSETPR
jgi:hypothetical protein